MQFRWPTGRDEPVHPAPCPNGTGSDAARLVDEIEALKTELAAARAKIAELEILADVDPLLGILNRRGFERELKRSLACVRRYGTLAVLIYLDVDDLKRVNDGHGHAAGDALLKAVAAALMRNVRASDAVGRLGGDEFAVILWNASPVVGAAKAAMLEEIVATAEISSATGPLSRGVSVGVTALSALDTPVSALDRADRAMYARKVTRRAALGKAAVPNQPVRCT